ncbi:MAG: radical SAM family heme chaperone HemW [Clostridia bacterium]|nr:radical SAM family heme chaperone HemW [Clostridia bacterium]
MMITDNIGLYIHIPFCRSKCPYCNFYSVGCNSELINKYKSKIIDTVNESPYCFDTVYFGGGTPSSMGSSALAEIIGYINHTDNCEITVECNPRDITEQDGEKFFYELATACVNRVSIGLQSAVESERRMLGRVSGKKEALKGIENAKNAGINNISLDLMIGIPEQTPASLEESLKFCTDAGVKHISAYILKIEDGTFFAKNKAKYNLPDEDAVAEMYLQTVDYLDKTGFRQYEISNFAVPGYESKHNLKYWNCEEYLGIGPGAHSFINGKRFYYNSSLTDFINNSPPVDDGPGGNEEEYIMLRLRLKDGVDFALFDKRFSHPLPDSFLDYALYLSNNGFAKISDTGISLTPEGFLISNKIIFELIERL